MARVARPECVWDALQSAGIDFVWDSDNPIKELAWAVVLCAKERQRFELVKSEGQTGMAEMIALKPNCCEWELHGEPLKFWFWGAKSVRSMKHLDALVDAIEAMLIIDSVNEGHPAYIASSAWTFAQANKHIIKKEAHHDLQQP